MLLLFLYGTVALLIALFVYYAIYKRRIILWLSSSFLVALLFSFVIFSKPYVSHRVCLYIYWHIGISCLNAEDLDKKLKPSSKGIGLTTKERLFESS